MTESTALEPLAFAAVEQLDDALLIADDAGRIRFSNRAAAALLGFEPRELLTRTVADLLGPDTTDPDGAASAASNGRSPFRLGTSPVRARRKDGDAIECELTLRRFDHDADAFYSLQLRQNTQAAGAAGSFERRRAALFEVLELFPLAVIVRDANDSHRTVMVNAVYEELFDVDRLDIIGRTDHDRLPEKQAAVLAQYYESVAQGRHKVPSDVIPVSTPRGRRFVRSNDKIVHDDSGRPALLLSVVEDRTELILKERQARIHRERAMDYLKVAGAILLEIDADGRIMLANQGLADACGLSQEQTVGLDYREIPFDSDGLQLWTSLVASALEGQQADGEVVSFEGGLGGKYYRWRLLANKHRTRDVIFSVKIMAEDVTEISERRMEAERANRAKSEFLAKMSHELRTPLSTIIGYGEMLQEQSVEFGDEEVSNEIRQITESGQHLLSLIDEVLNFARIESGNLSVDIAPIDLDELLAEVRSVAVSLSANHGNALTVDGSARAPLISDGAKVRQILHNLLANAAKFTERGQVHLHYEVDAESARFTVTDTGIGIPEASRTRIFEAFSQLSGPTGTRFTGTGLGLTMCKQLCDALGGTIKVDSEPGRGSTFTVVLPQAKQPGAEPGKPVAETDGAVAVTEPVPEQAAPRQVLLVEDNELNQDMMTRRLKRLGYEVSHAVDGVEAIAQARHLQPDVILMDVSLPRMDGNEATRRIKGDSATAHIPIITLTAHALPEDEQQAREAGADDFATKPVNFKLLTEKIEQLATARATP